HDGIARSALSVSRSSSDGIRSKLAGKSQAAGNDHQVSTEARLEEICSGRKSDAGQDGLRRAHRPLVSWHYAAIFARDSAFREGALSWFVQSRHGEATNRAACRQQGQSRASFVVPADVGIVVSKIYRLSHQLGESN